MGSHPGATIRAAAACAALLSLHAAAPGGTGACCADAGQCTVADVAACPLPHVYFPGLTCSPSPCAAMVGACCNADGACTLTAPDGCAPGGYAGDGTVCATVPCPLPTGACCTSSGGCWLRTGNDCLDRGSSYYGDGTVCGPGDTCPLGACCLPSGECTAGITEPQCAMWHGTSRGLGSTCTAANCPLPVGACCSGPSCAAIPLALCNVFGGAWAGPGTACGPGVCAGVCCRGATCADGVAPSRCTSPAPGTGAAYAGAGSCTQTPPLCCLADFNKTNGVEVIDIFDFLRAWFEGSPWADAGGAGAGAPDLQDIFSFLNVWFAGC